MNKLTLPLSVSTLIESIGDRTDFTTAEITQLLKAANIQKKDLKDFTTFDHPKKEGYGRKLVYQTNHFEVLVVSWAPGDFTAIHNHGYTNWGAVKTFGRLEHSTYSLDGDYLTTLFREKLAPEEVIPVDQSLIHQMGNPYQENVLSIHVYGTSQMVDGITENSQLFEIGKGEVQYVDGGAFYDLPKSQFAIANSDLHADRLTTIGHYTQLLNFYHKTGVRGAQYRKAVNYFHDRSFESRLTTELEMDEKQVLYLIELKKAKHFLRLLGESTQTIDSILMDLNDPENFS